MMPIKPSKAGYTIASQSAQHRSTPCSCACVMRKFLSATKGELLFQLFSGSDEDMVCSCDIIDVELLRTSTLLVMVANSVTSPFSSLISADGKVSELTCYLMLMGNC